MFHLIQKIKKEIKIVSSQSVAWVKIDVLKVFRLSRKRNMLQFVTRFLLKGDGFNPFRVVFLKRLAHLENKERRQRIVFLFTWTKRPNTWVKEVVGGGVKMSREERMNQAQQLGWGFSFGFFLLISIGNLFGFFRSKTKENDGGQLKKISFSCQLFSFFEFYHRKTLWEGKREREKEGKRERKVVLERTFDTPFWIGD